jgi:hypothetical protein
MQPVFNQPDQEWVLQVGRYIMNMGALEHVTRELIHAMVPGNLDVYNAPLDTRLGFLRKRFPREPVARHEWAMKVFAVAKQHVGFRNIVAHSPLHMLKLPNGKMHVAGIKSIDPKDPNSGQLIGLDEIKGRVNESSTAAHALMEMQTDYGVTL